jgi:prepilin-type N-terminal cleavage/methylation domain-containing protein
MHKNKHGFTPLEVNKGKLSNGAVKKQPLTGFTLIELLVVVAIIGLLASVVMVSLGNARLKSRDARRLADIQQIKSGLDIYYNMGSGYPDDASWTAAQTSQGQLSCSGQSALKVPNDPSSLTGGAAVYTYTAGGNSSSGCGGTVYSNYKIQFQTEGASSLGGAGTYFLSPNGITTVAPF